MIENSQSRSTMVSRDEAFAQGFRLAWRWAPVAALVAIGSFLAIAALGYWWEQIEAASAFQRIVK